MGAVGGGAAPVHGLPLDCGRAAGGTEVIRHVAGRLSRGRGEGRGRGRGSASASAKASASASASVV